jgi:hypothetical protein
MESPNVREALEQEHDLIPDANLLDAECHVIHPGISHKEFHSRRHAVESAPLEEKQPQRTQYYKKDEIMYKECEAYVMAGKRLPKLHSRWLLNRHANSKLFEQSIRGTHNCMVDELKEAKATIQKLQERIKDLEKEQERER